MLSLQNYTDARKAAISAGNKVKAGKKLSDTEDRAVFLQQLGFLFS